MRRFWLVAVMLLALALTPQPTPAAACQLAPSFSALHAALPSVVGDCTADPVAGPDGDTHQATTGGLLAWRGAWHWASFTDGATTWIDSPCGLVSRSNGEFFPWEYDQGPCGISAEPRLQPVAHVAPISSSTGGGVAAAPQSGGTLGGSGLTGSAVAAAPTVSCPYPLPYDLHGTSGQQSSNFCLSGGTYNFGLSSTWGGPYDINCAVSLYPAPDSDVEGSVLLVNTIIAQGTNWHSDQTVAHVPGANYYLSVIGCANWSAHITQRS